MSIDISVVTPTFRRNELLLQAIGSALGQKGVSVEIIVVDDSPEGAARAAVASVGDARVRYMKSLTPSGGKPALVRNFGAKHATGKYVHFLDDDDIVAEGYYQDATVAFDAHPGTGVVFGRIEPFGTAGHEALAHEHRYFRNAARRTRRWARLGSRRLMAANLLFMPTLLVNSACIIRREYIAGLGGYDPDLSLNEDVDFFCRAIRAHGCQFLDRVVVHYRILADSLMHGRADDRKLFDSYQSMYARYRNTHGAAELLAMKVFARSVLRIL